MMPIVLISLFAKLRPPTAEAEELYEKSILEYYVVCWDDIPKNKIAEKRVSIFTPFKPILYRIIWGVFLLLSTPNTPTFRAASTYSMLCQRQHNFPFIPPSSPCMCVSVFSRLRVRGSNIVIFKYLEKQEGKSHFTLGKCNSDFSY